MNIKLAVTAMMTCALLSAEAQAVKEPLIIDYPTPTPNFVLPLGGAVAICCVIAAGAFTIQVIRWNRMINPQGSDWWPKVLWSTPGTDPRLAGKWVMQVDRNLPCGGCWYKNVATGAATWLQSNIGDEKNKSSEFFWVITDREFNLASTCYAMSDAPGLATADDWNHPGQSPLTQWWHGGVGQLAWPGITNFFYAAFGFTTNPPAGMQSLPEMEQLFSTPQITLENPEFLGTNDCMNPGNMTNACRSFGMNINEPAWYTYDGGKWGYNGQPANYGGNPGGLPWLTNTLYMDYTLRRLKVDLSNFTNGTVAVWFYMTNLETAFENQEGQSIVPINVSGTDPGYTYTIQKGDENGNWTGVIDLQIIGNGRMTFLDNFAGEHQSYRVKATK